MSSHRKILVGFVLVMAAAALLALTALCWLYQIDTRVGSLPAAATPEVVVETTRSLVRKGYWIVIGVGAAGTLLSCACVWWILSTLGRVLRSVGRNLQESSARVLDSTAALSADSEQLADNATSAAGAISQTTGLLNSLVDITGENSARAESVKQLAREAHQAAEAGAGEMRALSEAMTEIQAGSEEVSRIVRTIDEIAFQTNILALNASVEAARAGPAGQGFAIVAAEVQALAQRSASSARETSEKIGAAAERMRLGVSLAGQTETRLQQIVACNEKLDTLATGVAGATSEQSRNIRELQVSCQQLDRLTQGNASTAEGAARSTHGLRDEAENLREVVITLNDLVEGGGRAPESGQPPGTPGRMAVDPAPG